MRPENFPQGYNKRFITHPMVLTLKQQNKCTLLLKLQDSNLKDNDGQVKIGTPKVEGAKVTAKVLSHLKGDKVIIFKKKRRKTFERKNGHRQYLTQIQIESINA